jgi:hypothetical protein
LYGKKKKRKKEKKRKEEKPELFTSYFGGRLLVVVLLLQEKCDNHRVWMFQQPSGPFNNTHVVGQQHRGPCAAGRGYCRVDGAMWAPPSSQSKVDGCQFIIHLAASAQTGGRTDGGQQSWKEEKAMNKRKGEKGDWTHQWHQQQQQSERTQKRKALVSLFFCIQHFQ